MAQSNLPRVLLPAIPLLKSCESCRQRKIKCSGDKPTCAHCARRNQPCIYRRSARYKRHTNGGATASSGLDALAGSPGLAQSGGGNNNNPGAAGVAPAGVVAQALATAGSAAGPRHPLTEIPGGSLSAPMLPAADNMPLNALFGTAPIDETDIMPPAILQSMNLWLNDSLLTAGAMGGGLGYGGSLPGAGLGLVHLPPDIRAASLAATSSPVSQNMRYGTVSAGPSNNLVPMDFALGLSGLSSHLSAAPGLGSANALAGLGGLSAGSAGRSLSLAPDTLQRLSGQLGEIRAPPTVGGPYPSAQTRPPPETTSPNALFGAVNAGMFSHTPTSAFASLDLVSPLDSSGGTGPIQALPNIFGAAMPELFSAVRGQPSPLGLGAGIMPSSMQPVPNMSSAATIGMACPPFPPGLAGLPGQSAPALPQSYPARAVPGAGAAGAAGVVTHAQMPDAVQPAVAAASTPRPPTTVDSPLGSGTSASSLSQMNNASIPQMLKDAVAAHPELGCAELIYNLLITHVVHDCSRIGIYAAHLFWMRVKHYSLPRFYFFAAIADASRSWTLSDELRHALPQNLDEVCYELALRNAPTAATTPSILAALGLYVLASYEFKSARFAPMVEHSFLAYKFIVSLQFRGVPFPWRAARGLHTVDGVDCNYQLLIRAFWRICTSLHYSIEIFNIDAPDNRDQLPEFPAHDEFFVQHVFVPDESEEFGFRTVPAPYHVASMGVGDFFAVFCELNIHQFVLANMFNQVRRGEKTALGYINFLREWDRRILRWRDSLPAYFSADLEALARQTQPLDVRRTRINLWGLSEDEMWQKRHQWNQDVGIAMEVMFLHIMIERTRIKGYRIGLMLLLHEDLDMVRNFQNSRALTLRELPAQPFTAPVCGSVEDDRAAFSSFAEAANQAASHAYELLKLSHHFGCDLHAFTVLIVGALLQIGLVYVGQVQATDARLAWRAMLRLAHILGMIRSLDRWGPALYSFTNILKALGRPGLILEHPSPKTCAKLSADAHKPPISTGRAASVDSAATSEYARCTDSCCQSPLSAAAEAQDDSGGAGGAQLAGAAKGKRKGMAGDGHGDEKRYEFGDHHYGDPHSLGAHTGSPVSDDDDMPNPFPPDHVISHIMREQKVNTSTFFSPTLPILAASLLHTNTM